MARRGSLVVWIAVILFFLAAIFSFFVHAVPSYVNIGLIALGLALWALDHVLSVGRGLRDRL